SSPAGVGSKKAKPYVMLGAHYDHLGRGGHGNSLAKKAERGQVHNGADDNASGVAAVLAAGARLAKAVRGRDIVLAFWSGEEMGLLGSSNFVKKAPVPPEKIAAYVNFDMVGRMRDNKLTVQAVGTSSIWNRLIEQVNVPVGFDIKLNEDPYLPTDVTTFSQARVPAINFFTGGHEDYHRPTDEPSRINYQDLERVVQFGARMAEKLANLDEPPDYTQVARLTPTGGGRDSLRAFTGTIPDYTTEVEGLLLGGVIEGGPAEEAGLREGDIIVEFAGQKITNIYDYTYALDAVKIGEPIKVIFLRDGERKEVALTPRARK
ncbi:MAG: M20/M25/M40 family metallo-hydrolase, partial [Acidobacteriota bacterium]